VYKGTVAPGVAINDNGLVALMVSTAPSPSLITTDGTTTTKIAGPSTSIPLPYGYDWQALSLNNNGFVSFRTQGSRGTNAIWKSNGTTAQLIADDQAFASIGFSATSIDDNGQVAFEAMTTSNPKFSIFVGNGASPAVQVSNHGGAVPSINNSGTIVYAKQNDDFSNTIEIQKGTETFAFPYSSSQRYLPDINDNGTVVALVSTTSIVIGDGISPSHSLDTSLYKGMLDSGLSYDGGVSTCAINNQNLVVFGAHPEAFTPSTTYTPYGLFTGSDPVADRVIMEGDMLDGATINLKSLQFCRNGLNNKGQIAFIATLSDGTKGVWVATPVPEPSILILLLGSFVGLAAGVWQRNHS
jgi:hypothetical protein